MAQRKGQSFNLEPLDDFFKTDEERKEDKLSKIRDIPIDMIDDFPDHPFKVRDDEDMQNLVESIRERGVIKVRFYDRMHGIEQSERDTR